jgi:hypothetical protein
MKGSDIRFKSTSSRRVQLQFKKAASVYSGVLAGASAEANDLGEQCVTLSRQLCLFPVCASGVVARGPQQRQIVKGTDL